MSQHCVLCEEEGGQLIWRDDRLRVVRVDDADYPGFCRVIWHAHVREMTDLAPLERQHLMMTVCKVEQAIRDVLQPDKINLASLGNQVPHLHWHIIPRFNNDAHFPQPIWAARPIVANTPQTEEERQVQTYQRQARKDKWASLMEEIQASLAGDSV